MISPKAGPADKPMQPRDERLAAFTVAYAGYIIISAAFMQQVWLFLTKAWGRENLYLFCGSLYLLLAVIVLLYVVKSRRHFLRVAGTIIVLVLSFLFAWRQPFFVEKLHVAEYGLLGWLGMRCLRRQRISGIAKATFFSFLFILLVGSIDEGLQKVLPYRVGEIRDVVTNLISGICGIILFLLANEKYKIVNN